MRKIIRGVIFGFSLLLAAGVAFAPSAQAAKEVKIGFSMALTGPLGPAGWFIIWPFNIYR